MPAFDARWGEQTRFFVRGSCLLIGLLMLWWFVFQNPMAWLLRRAAQAGGAIVLSVPASKMIVEAANGDWTFEIPLEFDVTDTAGGAAKHYRSINFDMARTDVNAFTFSLPVFWAIMLASPGRGRRWRALLTGTAFISLSEVVLLLFFAEIFAHRTAARMTHSTSAYQEWFFHLSEYMAINVVPYVLPFVVALWTNRELRARVLGWFPADSAAAATNADKRQKSGVVSKRELTVSAGRKRERIAAGR